MSGSSFLSFSSIRLAFPKRGLTFLNTPMCQGLLSILVPFCPWRRWRTSSCGRYSIGKGKITHTSSVLCQIPCPLFINILHFIKTNNFWSTVSTCTFRYNFVHIFALKETCLLVVISHTNFKFFSPCAIFEYILFPKHIVNLGNLCVHITFNYKYILHRDFWRRLTFFHLLMLYFVVVVVFRV